MDVAIKEMSLSYEDFRMMVNKIILNLIYKILQEDEMTFMAKFRHERVVGMYGITV